jgi:8-oxo-dGTP pyrophosphatase MutT (NUDIX family)
MKKFKNKSNIPHKLDNGKIIWEDRSIAVTGTIIIKIDDNYFVLAAKRGYKSIDFQGKWNLICGYLDWNETLSEAIEREIWEEVGLDLNIVKKFCLVNNLNYPWLINDNPNKSNKQNVTHHFGCISVVDKFPLLTVEYNEVNGEVEDYLWISINSIDDYNWAFNHNKIIKLFVKKYINKNI